MSSWKISYRIEQICKEMGINYKSPYLEKTNFHDDAMRLNELYYQIKQLVGEIVEIADKHGATELSALLWNDIKLLENVDHDLIKIATKLNNKDKENAN